MRGCGALGAMGLCVGEGSALKHREAGSECVMESESCQTIVLQWSQGERGRAGLLLGKEG